MKALAAAALLVIAQTAFAQPASVPVRPKETHTISRASSPVVVDGVLDETAWKTAKPIPLNYEWFPGENVPPPVSTTGYLAFDDTSLYVAFRADDPRPEQIRAHLTDRDVAFQDDTVGFLFDPFNDQRRAFQFRVNAAGVQMDATNSDADNSEDWSWDAIWTSAAKINRDGYVVEAAIPFSSLRFPSTASVQTWGFVLMRDYPRTDRHRIQSSPRDRNRTCQICQFDQITGFEGLRPGRNIEVDPTVTASRTDVRRNDRLEAGDAETDAGVTAKWGITPDVTLNATINPDFSQVEADAAQLAVNERFTLSYPEKRPFFLEGADFFNTPIRVVFTRTIANPVWGLKTTGKRRRSAFGVLVARDEINNLLFPGYDFSRSDSIDQSVLNTVVRYRLDVGRTSNLGVLFTDREASGYHNRVGGVDGQFRLTRSDTVRFHYLLTDTAYPDAIARRNGQPTGSFRGKAMHGHYDHQTRNWFAFANYRAQDPGFRPDAGFIVRVDYKTYNAGVERHFWGKPGGRFQRIIVGVAHDETWNYANTGHEDGNDLTLTYVGPLQSRVSLNVGSNTDYFNGVHYSNPRQSFSFEMRPSGSVALFVFGGFGKVIDYANSRQARRTQVTTAAELNIGNRVSGELEHTFQRLEVEPGRLFDANLTQARLVYHLNLRTFLRAIVQHTDVARNSAAYTFRVNRRNRNLFTQLLFSYKLNPRTAILAGYSDSAQAAESPERIRTDLMKTDRTLFLKLAYAFLF